MNAFTSESLQGQVAVVTGAGRGIGRAIAVGYAAAGASVCCAARSAGQVQETVDLILAAGGKAAGLPADVRQLSDMVALFDFTAQQFGGVDTVVVNAGVSLDHRTVEQSNPQEWQDVIDTNLTDAYFTSKAAVPHLKKRGGGKIILVGSGLGHHGMPARAAYACSKAGVWMLTRILAQELAADCISVNELIPGPVNSSMAPAREEDLRARFGSGEWFKTPEDVVPLAVFLASQPLIGPTAQSFSLMRRDQ